MKGTILIVFLSTILIVFISGLLALLFKELVVMCIFTFQMALILGEARSVGSVLFWLPYTSKVQISKHMQMN